MFFNNYMQIVYPKDINIDYRYSLCICLSMDEEYAISELKSFMDEILINKEDTCPIVLG